MNTKKIILSVGSFCLMGMSIAQMATQNTQTVTNVVENTLIGEGTIVTNISSNGAGANAIHPGVQTFTYTGTDFPFSSGVMLQTNGTTTVNVDSDLNSLSFPNAVTSGVIIEFDFIATGDSMSFNYIFASSEYQSFTCSNVNDVFGFFLSGPGINGPFSNNAVNIATIPGTTTPVGINSVNSGFPANNANCLLANPNYMTDNIYFTLQYNTILPPTMGVGPTSYNGATVVMTAFSGLICDEEYHIKLGIANVGDNSHQSAVFLEGESFKIFGYEILVQPSVIGPTDNGFFAEGCTSAELVIIRPSDSTVVDTLWVPTNWEGSDGFDPYTDLLDWPDSIAFPPGVDTISFFFTPIDDGIEEGPETVTITLIGFNACGIAVPTSVTFTIVDNYDLTYDITPTTTVQCMTTTAAASVGNLVNTVGDVSYLWTVDGETISTSPTITMGPGTSPQQTITYVVSISDDCQTIIDTVLFIVNQTLGVNPNSTPTACGLSTGTVSFPPFGQNGSVAYELSGVGITNAAGFLTQNVAQNLPSGWYYITATDAVCDTEDSVFVDILDPPVANLTANPMSGFAPLTVTFTNNNENADSHWWDFGNGETLSTTSSANQTITYVEEGPYNVTVCLAALQAGCSDTACLIITVLEFIPPPVVATPNVFSPNGDNINDVWEFITKEFVEKIELVIVNRWGSVVNEQTSATPTWDGKLQDGSEAVDGVYFYKYKATGLDGSTIEGHGSISLIRD